MFVLIDDAINGLAIITLYSIIVIESGWWIIYLLFVHAQVCRG